MTHELMRRHGPAKSPGSGRWFDSGFGSILILLLFGGGLMVSLRSDARPQPGSGLSGRPVLHTYIEPPGQARRSGDGSAQIPSPEPIDSRSDKREPVYNDASAGRNSRVEPDTHTAHHSDGVYHAAFNPTVAPFKRMNAADKLGEDFSISVGDERVREVPLTSPNIVSGRDFFWGSFFIEGTRGEPVPIPSVSPCMLVHEVRTLPEGINVEIYKDGADNFFVGFGEPGSGPAQRKKQGGKVRIQILVSGSKSYFGGALPTGIRLGDLRGERPVLPGNVAQAARLVLKQLDISHSDSLAAQLRALVSYFRGFEEGPMVEASANTGISYLDLSFARKGVCRHRAYAFVITAHALGIPARYVANEVHAFVEVLLPRTGWRRIDLGGAVPQMELLRGGDQPMHKPLPDPFPQPPGYADRGGTGMEAVSGDGRDPRQGGDPGSMLNPLDPDGKGLQPGVWVDAGKLGLEEESVDSGDEEVPEAGLDDLPPITLRDKRDPGSSFISDALNGLRKTVEFAPVWVKTSGLRGSRFKASGRIGSSGEPVSGHRVVILFHPPGRGAAVVMGETMTDDTGKYFLETLIPRDIPAGSYKVHVHSPVQGEYEKATSR